MAVGTFLFFSPAVGFVTDDFTLDLCDPRRVCKIEARRFSMRSVRWIGRGRWVHRDVFSRYGWRRRRDGDVGVPVVVAGFIALSNTGCCCCFARP